MSSAQTNVRPAPDAVLVEIADYVRHYRIDSDFAWDTAHLCLIDSIGCAFEALGYPACTNLLGPIVPGTVVPNGARVLATCTDRRTVEAMAVNEFVDLLVRS